MTIDSLTREKITGFKMFEGLSEQEVDAVIACGRIVHYHGGEQIIEESSQSSDLCLILNGRLSIEMMARDQSGGIKHSKQIAVLRSGDMFGDMAFLSGTRRSASASTIDDFSAVMFDYDMLHNLFDNNTRIGYIVIKNIAKTMSNRLMELNFMLRDY